MKLAAIGAQAAFLDTLARRWLEAGHDGGLIMLPTRRAARGLAEAFLRVTDGRPLLLPRITALGALDETPLALAGVLDLPPPVEQLRRLAELSRLVMALPERHGGVRGADRAWMLARELASLMDEAERAELDLAAALLKAAEGDYAVHWHVTLRFLEIVTASWPAWLAEQGACNPAWRQVALLRAQAEAWRRAPPAEPVWVAGVTGGIPAAAELVRVVAGLPTGHVFLPGLDRAMPDAQWEALEPAHPQAGLARLLAGMGGRRGDAEALSPNGARFALLASALAPSGEPVAWGCGEVPDLTGLSQLSAPDPQGEAVAIAMVLRDALERPGARAALVTPDRALAARVASELLRWGVVADDSAGEPLGETPPAVFLRLLAAAVAQDFAPVALLALLKHPFAACGLAPAACRAAARRLEVACLRGPRPLEGLAGLRLRVDGKGRDLPAFLARFEACVAPLLRPEAAASVAPAAHLAGLVEAAEALASSDTRAGPETLWGDEEGEALAALLAEAIEAVERLPDQPSAALPGLLDALLEGQVVRSRRALRGRGGIEHPRVFIWGLLEARLQSVDTVVLGGLVEGVWPPATDPGPWMSRPMRQRAGLPSPEERVGQAAHDFVMAACAAPVAVLSCPRRRNGAPTVPSRWLLRLEVMLQGCGVKLPQHPAGAWAGALDEPPGGQPSPVGPPRPCPPVALRPTGLSVTEIETWLHDPYAIHARHILGLRPLDPLEQATDASDYGTIVHDGLHRFLRIFGGTWPADGREQLRLAMQRALGEAMLRPALREWWEPRLLRIADWVAEQEVLRRSRSQPLRIGAEVKGKWLRDGFELRGRADRIEVRADGTLGFMDYKTGALPTVKEADSGDRPQLPLEAAMAEFGGFGPDFTGIATELTYWHLSGGFTPGEARAVRAKQAETIPTLVGEVSDRLDALVRDYRDPARPYLSQPHPGRVPRFSDYAQLARVAEWSGGSEPE